MRMSSSSSTPPRRIPQQKRGERRVADLLEAAAAVIAEQSYPAATMTAIAERAGASIGAVYQYFPNKEAVAVALRERYRQELRESWGDLEAKTAGLTPAQLGATIVEIITCFMDQHPAYLELQAAAAPFRKSPGQRSELGDRLTEVMLRARDSALAPEQARQVALAALGILKGLHALYPRTAPAERRSLIEEFKLALGGYLEVRLRK
jgi:AcrR family transcriptional regulator